MFPKESNEIVSFIQQESIDSLEIVLKITERCNIACTYCYYFFGGDESYASRSPVISKNKIDDLILFIDRSIKFGVKNVRFVFHGGEPLLMKKRKFKEMLLEIKTELENKVTLDFAIQTNAILIDDEWIKIFNEFKVFVGVSIDGPREYNDLYRIDKMGKGTYQRTINGIDKLFLAYRQGLIPKPGVICVINPDFNAKIIYNHLTRDLCFDNLHFLYQDLTHMESSDEYIEKVKAFTSDLIDIWISDSDNKIKVRFLNNYIKEIAKTPFYRDVISKYMKMRSLIITIDSNGDIGPEDTLRSLVPNSFGGGLNISTSNLYDLFNNEDFMEIYRSEHMLPEQCSSCDWRSICKGGYLKNRYKSDDSRFNNKSIYCEVITETLETLTAFLCKNGIKLDDIEKNLEVRY